MGLLKNWINEMGNTWDGMARGDASSFLGLGGSTTTGTGHAGTGPGHTPDGIPLSPLQRSALEDLFEKHYRRYPISEHEFQAWLRNNW